jgi:hypothetical protein
MAATDARPVPIKNTAFRYYFSIRKNDGTLITTWTGADSEVSLDGAAFSDCTNEATEIGTTGCGYIDLTSSEMNADAVTLKITVTNTSALTLVVTFFPQEAGDIKVDATHFGGSAGTFSGGRPEVNTTHLAGTAYASADLSATMKTSINAEADTALSDYGALKPTTAGRTLDVTATGAAGIDWGNVENPTTTLNLSGTTVKTVTDAVVATISGTLTTLDSLWTEIKKWLRIMIRSDAFIAADYSDVTASINANTGSGIGSYNNTTESLRALHAHAEDTQTAVEALPAAGAIADAVWDEATSGHSTAGTTGKALTDAGSAGDPWSTALPGAYTAGSAGYILGTNLNATVGSRSSHSAADVWSVGTRTLSAFGFTVTTNDAASIAAILEDTGTTIPAQINGLSIPTAATIADAVCDEILSGHATAGSLAKAISDILADTGTDGVVLSAATCNKIADHVRRRTQANVEASSDGDTLALSSLYGLIQQIQEAAAVGTTLTIYKTDGTTSLGTKTLATDPAAEPVTGVS